MAGAFQTSRDIFENSIWFNVVEFRMFFLIYGKAAFSDNVRIGDVVLKRGQWVRSMRNLQSDLEYVENRSVKKYSLSTIHRAVDNLVKQNRISVKQCELGTLFEVVNYAKYQGLENYKPSIENAERTESEREANGSETEREQQPNNNKKDLIRSKKEKNSIYTPEFEKFYSEYPRPQAKADTFKNWQKRVKEHGIEYVLMCFANYMDYYNQLPDEKKEFAYSSNNFLGLKAYYKDYESPKVKKQQDNEAHQRYLEMKRKLENGCTDL